MSSSPYLRSEDAVVVGAGPVGCAAALALARAGARVVLLEANPAAAKRLAGEWLHPQGVAVLRRLGVEVSGDPARGFVVFPGQAGDPVLLPYADGYGLACEHEHLVTTLREAAEAHDCITLVRQRATLESLTELRVGLVVGADGRASTVRRAAGLPSTGTHVSTTAGVVLEDVDLPFEGFGHVLLGGPGPVLVYRLGENRLRACIDVPNGAPRPAQVERVLWDSYGHAFPGELAPAFRRALRTGQVDWAANRFRSRTRAADFGSGSILLAGDAAGHYHPLTAVGMTVGLADAECVAAAPEEYRRERARASRVPELLATGLYAAFTRPDAATTALRAAMLALWDDPRERERTMRLLSTDDARPAAFYRSFVKVLALTAGGLAGDAVRRRSPTADGFAWWLRWLTAGSLRLGA